VATYKKYSELGPEVLIKLLEKKDADLEKKQNDLVLSEQVIGELKTDLAKKDDEILVAAAVPTVKVGKDTYEIVIPYFNLYDPDSQTVDHFSTKDVIKDDKLAAKLVKMGSGVLRKIEKK
jgi:hypothetical protein